MELKFIKFSANGNDFIAIDNRQKIVSCGQGNIQFWKSLCARKTGIGADGILLLDPSEKADFKMIYLNSDGREAEMCGNGASSITFFAHMLGLRPKSTEYSFETKNNIYHSLPSIDHKRPNEAKIKLKMCEIHDIDAIDLSQYDSFISGMYLNTGVPHCVFLVSNLDSLDVKILGRSIRNNKILFPDGTNVNFIQRVQGLGRYHIRTYERGVEDETLSCGTGTTAAAIASALFDKFTEKITIISKGGEQEVFMDENFRNVYLSGRVEKTFQGSINI